MSDKTAIEWADATWNPTVGCSIVSKGCTNCYAMKMAGRLDAISQAHEAANGGDPGPMVAYRGTTTDTRAGAVWTGKVNVNVGVIDKPLRWKKPRRIFVNSMSDLFHENLPDEAIDKIFAVMALAPQHTFQVLTKRADRMRAYFQSKTIVPRWGFNACIILEKMHPELSVDEITELGKSRAPAGFPPPNVWLGVSVEDQAAADERIPHLLATPAAKRFLSCEPLLGPVDLTRLTVSKEERRDCLAGELRAISNGHTAWRVKTPPTLDWVIVGGESGPGARPMHPYWARSLRDQCQAASVPFFFKQWGNWKPVSHMTSEEIDALYEPAPEHHPDARRRCKVRWEVLQLDGSTRFDYPPGAMTMFNVGKKRAGALLDDREWRGFPR